MKNEKYPPIFIALLVDGVGLLNGLILNFKGSYFGEEIIYNGF